jgi:hypothetical protein
MAKASGYILDVDGIRRDELLEAFEFGETPSEGVPSFSHNSNQIARQNRRSLPASSRRMLLSY